MAVNTRVSAQYKCITILKLGTAKNWPYIQDGLMSVGYKRDLLYRVTHLLANLGWVDFDFGCSTLCLVLPGKLAELAEHLGKMVEHPKSDSTQHRFARRGVTL